jgi:hypothetical protein
MPIQNSEVLRLNVLVVYEYVVVLQLAVRVCALTSTAARAKLRRRAKRPPQFGVGLADSLGAIIVQRVLETRPAVVLVEMV